MSRPVMNRTQQLSSEELIKELYLRIDDLQDQVKKRDIQINYLKKSREELRVAMGKMLDVAHQLRVIGDEIDW